MKKELLFSKNAQTISSQPFPTECCGFFFNSTLGGIMGIARYDIKHVDAALCPRNTTLITQPAFVTC